MKDELQNRRPLATRNKRWAQQLAQWIARTSITPNQISILSVVFAAIGFYAGYSISFVADVGGKIILLLVTAAMIQLRLLCNMMDGLVAVEGGKKSPTGDLFNDVPDRIADILLIMGLACSFGGSDPLVMWGWAASLGSVLTAYMRNLASALGLPADFGGPMAKQHRMFTLTLACLLASGELQIYGSMESLKYIFIVVTVGTGLTFVRRAVRAYRLMSQRQVK